jgi:membrane protein implicated in regulation of membrane protease activity
VWGALSKHDRALPLGSKVRITEMQGTRVVVEPLDTASQNQETP